MEPSLTESELDLSRRVELYAGGIHLPSDFQVPAQNGLLR